ncbi:hypothetical protein CsSME_00051603 [Camellia sinensis var. sinensis]
MCTVHVFVCWVLGTCSAAEVWCPYSSAIEAEWTWTNVCPDDFAGGSWFTMLAMVDSHLYDPSPNEVQSAAPPLYLLALQGFYLPTPSTYLSISFIQMLKALMPVAVYSIGIIFRKDSFNSNTMANMLFISFDVVIAAYGEAKFDSWGVFLQLGAVGFEATRLVLIQILLTSKGITLNPITSLYYFAPCCFVFIFVPCLFIGFPVLRDTSSFHFDFSIFGTNSVCALL